VVATALHADRAFDGEQVVLDATVVVEDGRIAWFGPHTSLPFAAPREERKLEDDVTLLPGFINCHAHLTLSCQLSDEGDISANEATQALRAHANSLKALSVGVTTQRDLGAPSTVVIDLARAVANGEVLGPNVIACGRALTTERGPGWPLNIGVRGVDAVRRSVRQQVAAGAAVIKVISGERLMASTLGSSTGQLTLEEVLAAVDEAHRFGVRVTAHAHTIEGIRIAIDAGVDSIEHASRIDGSLIERCTRQGIGIVPTLSMLDAIVSHAENFDPSVVEEASSVIQSQRRTVREAYDAGVTLAVGTDAGSSFNPGHNYARELEIRVEIGMSVIDVLRGATSTAADLVGMPDVGRLRPGAKADLVAVRGNPIDDINVVRNIVAVWKDGKQVPDVGGVGE
jgi:imidazolonepropionase-like amidohydrolase